ncbi:MAG: hypothetical protein IPG63_17700 [Xanthomonadales bacterium]|nr:hypothetical protein [Xanthomonadales bacterium]
MAAPLPPATGQTTLPASTRAQLNAVFAATWATYSGASMVAPEIEAARHVLEFELSVLEAAARARSQWRPSAPDPIAGRHLPGDLPLWSTRRLHNHPLNAALLRNHEFDEREFEFELAAVAARDALERLMQGRVSEKPSPVDPKFDTSRPKLWISR